ncbi:transmembrane protein 116-like isoform X2 [Mauremys mutica]|uniref:transmembrane protein 116-like isoform X2 n=1 Tax=Mauremys mutica TaxID=74926 RepID=UPI001D153094|nr:transmembrane protein 116-like isoform X2 [Mauremys mutica]
MVAPGCSGRLQGIKGRLLPRPLCEIVGGWLGELLQPRSPGCVRCHPLPGTGVEQTKQAKVTTAVQSTAACEGERRLGAEHHHRLQELSPGGGAGRLFALESTEKATASSMDTTSGGNNVSALSNDKIFVLTRVYLAALSLSLVGSSSVLAVATLRRRCFHSQLRPLFLLSLADFLAALVLIITAAIQLLPAQLFILAYEFCPYGLMLAMMFYAISFLMVIVYAYEVNRTIRGWRVTHEPAPQERSRCMERAQHCLPYVLAWLLPALTFLGQLLFRGTSVRDIAPTSLKPVMPHTANRSRGADSLYCSSCLILIHRSQDVCYKYVGGKDTGLEMKILFFMYLLLVLSCSTFLYCRVKRWCRRNNEVRLLNMENDGFASRNIQSVCKISRCFQLVFLICWTPAFLLSLLSFTSIEPTSIFALHVAMALTMSLQGLLHSLVYGWLRQNFRQEALGETLPLRYYPGLKAFYDESFGVEC